MSQALLTSTTAAGLVPRLERYTRPGVPKYIAMRDAVADAVTSGAWPVGTRLPPESVWAAQLPLSLGTIQRALRILVEDGVVVRRPKHGTYVAERGVGRMHAPLHCRFVDGTGSAYLPVYPKVTARYQVTENGPWSRHLRAAQTMCIERVLGIGTEFKVFSRFYFDPGRLSTLATAPVRKLSGENFKDVLWRETGQPIGRISQFLSSARLPQEICKAIGVRPRAPGDLLEIFAFTGDGQPIYYQELHMPPHQRRLHLATDGKNGAIERRG